MRRQTAAQAAEEAKRMVTYVRNGTYNGYWTRKVGDSEWTKVDEDFKISNFNENRIYVIDDITSDIRKAYYDGEEVQTYEYGEWYDVDELYVFPIGHQKYRFKAKHWYDDKNNFPVLCRVYNEDLGGAHIVLITEHNENGFVDEFGKTWNGNVEPLEAIK